MSIARVMDEIRSVMSEIVKLRAEVEVLGTEAKTAREDAEANVRAWRLLSECIHDVIREWRSIPGDDTTRLRYCADLLEFRASLLLCPELPTATPARVEPHRSTEPPIEHTQLIVVQIEHTNDRGERLRRLILPYTHTLRWQRDSRDARGEWVFDAWDCVAREKRTFSMASLHRWWIPVTTPRDKSAPAAPATATRCLARYQDEACSLPMGHDGWHSFNRPAPATTGAPPDPRDCKHGRLAEIAALKAEVARLTREREQDRDAFLADVQKRATDYESEVARERALAAARREVDRKEDADDRS